MRRPWVVLFYTLKKISEEDKIGLENLILSTLNKEKGEKFMLSIADSYIRQGREEGIHLSKMAGIKLG
jgi:hypothetical protein